MEAGASKITVCANCGHRIIRGKFCSECGSKASSSGTAVESDDSEGWSSLTGEFFSPPHRNGMFSVALSFLRAPVDTINRLTDDPVYRSNWAFMSACIGAQLTFVFVMMPRLFAAMFGLPDVSNTSEVVTNEIVQYVGMAILIPVQYYMCCFLGTRARTPRSYVKFCTLSVGYSALVSIIVALLLFVVGVFAIKTGALSDMRDVSLGLTGVSLIVILAFVAASHRVFWGMKWWAAIAATIVMAGLSWYVVFPGLTSLTQKANIQGTLGYLFG